MAIDLSDQIVSFGLARWGCSICRYLFPVGAACPPYDMIGKCKSGLVVSVRHRTPSKDRLPPHGIDAIIGIRSREPQAAFSVARGNPFNADRTVLRVPYAIGDTKGTIEVRSDDEKWMIQPDHEQRNGGWWEPFAI